MQEFLKAILKKGWRDDEGNVLIFIDGGIFDEQGHVKKVNTLIMAVDGADCSEGIQERVDCSVKSVCEVLEWYGYKSISDMFSKWASENFPLIS